MERQQAQVSPELQGVEERVLSQEAEGQAEQVVFQEHQEVQGEAVALLQTALRAARERVALMVQMVAQELTERREQVVRLKVVDCPVVQAVQMVVAVFQTHRAARERVGQVVFQEYQVERAGQTAPMVLRALQE